jgi:hypothetical protein
LCSHSHIYRRILSRVISSSLGTSFHNLRVTISVTISESQSQSHNLRVTISESQSQSHNLRVTTSESQSPQSQSQSHNLRVTMAASRLHFGSWFSFSAIVVLLFLWAEHSEAQTVGTNACVLWLLFTCLCVGLHTWVTWVQKLFGNYTLSSHHVRECLCVLYTLTYVCRYISVCVCIICLKIATTSAYIHREVIRDDHLL